MAAGRGAACSCLTRLWERLFGSRQPSAEPSKVESEPIEDPRYVKRPPKELYTALWEFRGRTGEELSFQQGDVFQILDGNGEWWLARKVDQFGRSAGEGYIPSNYLAKGETVEAQPWYFGYLSRSEAINLLLSSQNCTGSFLIRISEKQEVDYVISVKQRDIVKHYKIQQNEKGEYYLNTKAQFTDLSRLVEHYKAKELCPGLKLTVPCTKQEPVLQDLSHMTMDAWERPKEEFTVGNKLGSGHFAQVFCGCWNNQVNVAIKMLNKDVMNHNDFQYETQIMKKLRHKNLVSLYAVCTAEDPFYIITELMSKGSLLDFLRSPEGNQLNIVQLVDMATQVADGMIYLEERNFIHRDLAARNILVGDNHICKIADFGLARTIKEDIYLSQSNQIPYKWTAPEAISHGRFSVKSDVWSFGVLLYEVVTYGGVPYPGMQASEVFRQVSRGYQMPRPTACPTKVYDIMKTCWRKNPEERPAFKKLKWQLGSFSNYDDST
ncbi:protein-tyrosine kinase 6 [Latimeria chalumnae]|uniref:protein-tyrosine kinase 6 n=1 Tax=Latimeria chalumnae TaxID=7897 RepID=UPI00313D2DB9